MPIVWRARQMMAVQRRAYVPRVNEGGNFCGHRPCSPRLDLVKPSTAKRRPRILKVLQVRLKAYYNSPRVLPSLNNANRSKRQQRSERREACLQLMTAILEFTDLASLRCGVPTQAGFLSLTLDYLVQFTGLGQRRAERALADLKSARLLTVAQPRQLGEDGQWRGLAAVKAVNKLLFSAFGLGHRLRHERDRAAARLKRKLPKEAKTRTAWARGALVLGGIGSGIASKARNKASLPPPAPAPIQAANDAQRRRDIWLAVIERHPEFSAAEARAETDRILALSNTAQG